LHIAHRIAIPAVDSWFAVVVTSAPRLDLSIEGYPPPSWGYSSLGRGLVTNNTCPDSADQLSGPGRTYVPCNIDLRTSGPVLDSNDEAFKILNNISTSHTVLPYYPDDPS